jgi:hypothetical protein
MALSSMRLLTIPVLKGSRDQVREVYVDGPCRAIQFAGAAVPAVDFIPGLRQAGPIIQPENITGADVGTNSASVASFRVYLNLHPILP